MPTLFTRPDGRAPATTPNGQPPIEPGQARRWMAVYGKESSQEAVQRAKKTMPWGSGIVRRPTSARGMWLFTVRLP